MATLACPEGEPCRPDFEVAYFDSADAIHTLAEVDEDQVASGTYLPDIDLGSLAGQEVCWMLVVRDPDNSAVGSWAVWLGPPIWRDPDVTPIAPAPGLASTPVPAVSGGIAAAASGTVDMSKAPLYLNDPIIAPSAVGVTFFNCDEGTWWWLQCTAMRPAFQMTVPPGRYHAVARARGTSGETYVTAGYTGQSPSCGLPLAEVTLGPNKHLTGLVIADWNWSCSGAAERAEMPAEVPLPMRPG